MPVLLGFLACEKVIVEEGNNTATLVSVMHDVYIPIVEGIAIPPGMSVPLAWTAFTMWYKAPDDGSKTFEQIVGLYTHADELLIQSEPLRFNMHKQVMRTVTPFARFPIYQPSDCVLKVFIRDLGLPFLGSRASWNEAMRYPITIHHTFYPV